MQKNSVTGIKGTDIKLIELELSRVRNAMGTGVGGVSCFALPTVSQ